jgi:FixJ family two-component response regulator
MNRGTKPPSSTVAAPDVVVIDDDESVREALGSLLRSVGLQTRLYEGADAFLADEIAAAARCLILDVRMPGVSGLEFQNTLGTLNIRMPIIFMTGHGDIPMSVRAMKAGAVDFLTKPFRDQDMLDAVALALEQERRQREDAQALSALKARLEELTPREREVMVRVAAGLMNKQIAAELGRSEITVKMHRGQVMQKMGVRSVAELARVAEALGLTSPISGNR